MAFENQGGLRVHIEGFLGCLVTAEAKSALASDF
jgi:hypothetical protein